MNITIISPHINIKNIGVRIIVAVLKKEGHKVKLIFVPNDLYGEKIDEQCLVTSGKNINKYSQITLELIMGLVKKSDLICISLNTNFFDNAVEISKKIKKDLAIPIVWGGPHATIKPKECLEYADFVCRGEGEGVIVELVEKLEKKSNYNKVKNLCFKDEKGNFIINPLRPFIQDLDVIPFQDYSLDNQYIILNEKVYNINKLYSKYFFSNQFSNNIYPTYVTRGCLKGCSYCYNEILNKLYFGQNIFRKRSVNNVIDELLRIKKILPFIENVHIIDDNFLTLNEEYIENFSKEYKKYINLPFVIYGFHPSVVSRKKLEYLTNAGLSGIRMGIQSASERTKKIYKRYYSNSQVEESCKIINEFKGHIKTIHYDIILYNPWETESDLIETLKFLTKIPLPYILVLYSLTFYPGTGLYERAKREDIIKDRSEEVYGGYYLGIKPTYINKLFYLLSDYVISGKRINLITILILTNKFFRKIGLSFLIYRFFRMKVKRQIELNKI